MIPIESDEPSLRNASRGEAALHVGALLVDAYVQCVASGLRFALKTTSVLAKGQIKFLNHLGNPEESSEQLRTVVDEARGCLRDVADVVSVELGQLRHRLRDLEEATRNVVADMDDADRPYRRRWKAKL